MDAQIQTYLRAAASLRHDAERVGPFLGAFDPHSDSPYRNYAIPGDGAEPSPNDVRALIDAFERRRRTPRLEYVPAASPRVEASLLAAGFAVEGRLPLMAVAPEAARCLPAPPGVELSLPTDGEGLRGAAWSQNVAYCEPTTTGHDVERLRATLAAGGIVVLARDAASSEAIGVVPAHRRRGVAGAICARLVGEAFAAGATAPFLMPAGSNEERIYVRAGFARVSEILHISRPRGDC